MVKRLPTYFSFPSLQKKIHLSIYLPETQHFTMKGYFFSGLMSRETSLLSSQARGMLMTSISRKVGQ